MRSTLDLPDDLGRRIDRLAQRTAQTPDKIVEDALSHGLSLAWQEKWAAGVQVGIDAADRGDFATDQEIAAVLGKYDPA